LQIIWSKINWPELIRIVNKKFICLGLQLKLG
jgi:hypothetical protein